ncbi:MAG TPA: protein-S-isoprenylcysteine O-methyltransferase [Gemmataceae bacterium]|jgi:protein-S-isoprenylcysteine O-methyltransferase Ste14
MDPWFGKAVILLANLVMVLIRAPHGKRSRETPVLKSRKGTQEIVLLTIAWIAFLLSLVWIATPLFAFSDYPLHVTTLVAGSVLLALGLWLFHRSHVDLGTNWSITLQVREKHQLVMHGLYRRVRHPMYLALLIFSAGQVLAVPNWLVGPSYLVAVLLLVLFRIGPEERMMREEFGKNYEEYMARSWCLIPGVW